MAGALLAECGLKHRSRLAYPALLIGANLPDIDVAVLLSDQAAMGLYGRRGWTHGVLAMAVLPVLLTVLLRGWSRWRRRTRESRSAHSDPLRSDAEHGEAGTHVPANGRRGPTAESHDESFAALWLVALIAVLSHPLLDLVNSYGVRLLMPFSDRWFYGDSIFIIDPWILAILIGGVWFTRRAGSVQPRPWIARAAALVLLAYIGAMSWVSRLAAQAVAREAGVEWPQPARELMMSAEPAQFATRAGVLDVGVGYELWSSEWTLRGTVVSRGDTIAKGNDLPCASTVRASQAARRYMVWSRFPFITCNNAASGQLNDARYPGRGGSFAQIPAP